MTAALLLGLWALLVTAVLPGLLAGARWARRAPALGVLAWHALGVSATAALALAVRQLADPAPHHHAGLLHLCGLAVPAESAARTAAALACAVAAVPAGLFTAAVLRGAAARGRHRTVLDLAGRHGVVPGAVVLDHAVPTVYCLPGLRRRVVVSRGALEALSADQLAAALAHEDGHLRGRHHLAAAAAGALGRVFAPLPLGRLVGPEVRALLEMAADDRALRAHSRRALAGAMTVVAAGRAPDTALTAGHHALARVQRLADPGGRPPRTAVALGAACAAALAALPLLLACLPHLA
ncbi:M56 family metallopeptidase [Kitasatospora sp. NPDC059571]|uniref:M56 family metallopeptidase n=1 Tax=Kitasatospora sp. NPDC059571 TaxID=3346871 RepID=UPI00367E2822